MFVDFNKTFQKKQQTQLTIPANLLDYLNQNLPENTKYIDAGNGDCVLVGASKPLKIDGFRFKLTKKQQEILGENYTVEDVLNYFYNMQKPLSLSLEKKGFVRVNDQEFPTDKLLFNLYEKHEDKSGVFKLIPQDFPPAFNIIVGCDEYERKMHVKRVPNNSVSTAEFESDKNEPLYMRYYLNMKEQEITFNISYNIKKAKTIRDIVESISIYNAFLEGKAYISRKLISKRATNDNTEKYNNILFWEKVMEIEEYLGKRFVPPKKEVDFNTMCLVEQLYQNLINKVPTIYAHKIDSIDGSFDFNFPEIGLESALNKPIFLEFELVYKAKLFGEKLELPSMIGIFNSVLKEYSREGKQDKLILKDENEEKKRYASIICFKTEKELKDFKDNDRDKMITLLHEAKSPAELVRMK